MNEGIETVNEPVTTEGTVETVTPATEPVATPTVTEPVVATEPVKPKRNRKPKAKAEKAKPKAEKSKAKPKVSVKRGRGRPAVFTGNVKKHIVAVIRKHGLTGGRVVLAEEGTSISLPTLGKFAAEAGIELHRGRPKAA
jgi:outer membrane biosynthesis protein TonB